MLYIIRICEEGKKKKDEEEKKKNEYRISKEGAPKAALFPDEVLDKA
jgi:hypothetical protein